MGIRIAWTDSTNRTVTAYRAGVRRGIIAATKNAWTTPTRATAKTTAATVAATKNIAPATVSVAPTVTASGLLGGKNGVSKDHPVFITWF